MITDSRDSNIHTIYKLPEAVELIISKEKIQERLPYLNNRDLRLLKNDIRSDISYLVFKNDAILIKFDYIAVIIFNSNHAYFIKFKDSGSTKFLKYIKNSFNLETSSQMSFKLFIFELILNYLSEITDDFLEKSFAKYSSLSIETFVSKQLTDILKFQHTVLLEKNKNQEYYESLIELVNNNLNFLLTTEHIKERENVENFINSYINRIKEDIKNLDRLSREIDTFIGLINVRLGEKRNKYALKTLNLGMFTTTLSISYFFVFMLGTNLKTHIEDSDYAFYIVMLVIIIINIPIYFILKNIFHK